MSCARAEQEGLKGVGQLGLEYRLLKLIKLYCCAGTLNNLA
jgi:hypothetical protein